MRTLFRKRWLAVAGFFGVQALLLHIGRWTSYLPDSIEVYFAGLGLGWIVAAICWIPLWWALHEVRGWRCWIELMVAVAAFAWPTLLTAELIEALWPPPPPPRNTSFKFFDGEAVGQFLMALLLGLGMLSGIVLVVAQWISGWRITDLAIMESGVEQISLRELMLGMTLFGGHLWVLQSLLRAMFTWDWADLTNWGLAAVIAGFAPFVLATSLLMLSSIRVTLGSSRSLAAWLLWVLSFLGLMIGILVMGDKPREAVLSLLFFAMGLSANAALGSFYWRRLGWRVEGRPALRHSENSCPA